MCVFVFLILAFAQATTVKAQGKKDAMATFQHVNGVMEDFEANKVLSLPIAHHFHSPSPDFHFNAHNHPGALPRSRRQCSRQSPSCPRPRLLVQQRHRTPRALQNAPRISRRILSQKLPCDGLGGCVSYSRHVRCPRNGAAHALRSAKLCHSRGSMLPIVLHCCAVTFCICTPRFCIWFILSLYFDSRCSAVARRAAA